MKIKILFLLFIFLIAFLYRFPHLTSPFWVDEFSTARNALLIMNEGSRVLAQKNEFFEHHNITEHLLVATSFKIFGVSESSARIPSVVIGSLVPVFLFVAAKKLFDRNTALAATALCLFSYFEITWARQARSYMLQQLFILISLYVYTSLVKKFSVSKFCLLLMCFVVGVMTHTTFLLFTASLGLHFVYLCFHWHFFNKESIQRFAPYIVLASLLSLLLFFNNYFQAIIGGLVEAIKVHPNNVWYYHSFLWREQTIVTLLAAVGLLLNILKYKKGTFLVIVPIISYLLFICFLFPPYVSRYILPIFPLLLILAGFAISTIASAVNNRFSLLIVLVAVALIVVNGDKFVVKPKHFYSVNHDMREVALIDYNQVYGLVKSKTGDQIQNTAIIDTWPDRARWYLGYKNTNMYYFHWQHEQGSVNGLEKNTVVNVQENEKFLPGFKNPPIRFVSELSDLRLAQSKYKQGFIFIDDATLPADVIEYAQSHFKKELTLDHYPLDDNPYSVWPATLYSWGFEN